MTQALAATRGRTLPWLAIVLGLAAAYALLWGAGFSSSHRAPPLDSAEQLVWSYALQGGYWKHPPLPSWILHALVAVFGPSVALPFFATLAGVAIALVLTWRLGCEFMGPQRSLVAMALTALVGYHGFGADAFNHNTVLLPFQAALTLFFWLAVRRGDWHLWGLAGLFAGLALLVKYVAVFPLAALLLYLLLDARAHTLRNLLGLLLAGAVAALLVAPHLLWLQAHDFLPLQYMRSVTEPLEGAGEAAASVAHFLRMQVVRVLPLLLALAWLARAPQGPVTDAPDLPPRDRLFLWTVGLGPLALIVLYGLATRTPLQARWGSHVFLLAGWLALDAVRRWPLARGAVAWRRLLAAHLVLWAVAVLVVPRLGEALDLRGRTRFPGAELAALAQGTWHARTGAPLRIVVSDVWLAGNIVAHGTPLAVLIDGEPERAPWVTPQDIARCGALVLQDRSPEAEAPAGIAPWMERATEHGTWTIPWRADGIDPEPVRIDWGLLPPAPGAGCAL